jgi:hypothetical protein
VPGRPMTDADNTYEDFEGSQWTQMRERGISEEIIAQAQRRKHWKEDVSLYTMIIKQQAWEHDLSCTLVEAYLRLCSALEGLARRTDAIARLQEGVARSPSSPELILALAKLLFKDDRKEESLGWCQQIFDVFATQEAPTEMTGSAECGDGAQQAISDEDAADAYYLGGWVKIHDDDHTGAYKIWRDGALAVPSSALLTTQYKKRQCWDDNFTGPDSRVSRYSLLCQSSRVF